MTRAMVRATAQAFGALAFAVVAAAVALLTVSAGPAEALPSYARQTGQPCAACHTICPGADAVRPPLQDRRLHAARRRLARAAARCDVHRRLHPHAIAAQDAPPRPACTPMTISCPSRSPATLPASCIGNVGSFIQVTGDPVDGTAFLDASDVRYADTLKLFGKDTIWGIDANNTPDGRGPLEHYAGLGMATVLLDRSRQPSGRRSRMWKTAMARSSAARSLRVLERHALCRRDGYKGLPVPVLQAFNDRQLHDRRAEQRRARTGASRSSRIGVITI